MVVSGDYSEDETRHVRPSSRVPCDVFISEATFGLPVFRHPDDHEEVARLLRSVAQFPERSHLVGAYALGKAQAGDPAAARGRLGTRPSTSTARSSG